MSESSVSSLTVTRLSQPQKMKTAISMPVVSAPTESIANGENHEMCGSTDPAGASFSQTRASATTAKMASVTTSAVSSQRCVRALSSMPMTQINVMTAIHMTPTAVTASVDGSSMPNSRNE